MTSFLISHLLWSSIVFVIMLSCEHDEGTVKFEHKLICFIPIVNSIWFIALVMLRGFELNDHANSMFKGVTKIKDFIFS